MKFVRGYESFKVMFTGNVYFPAPPPLGLLVVSWRLASLHGSIYMVLSPQKMVEIRPAHSNKRLLDPRMSFNLI